MKRRDFLKILGLGAAALAFPKMALTAVKQTTAKITKSGFFLGAGNFFIGDRDSYVWWDGSELKVKGQII